MDNEILLPLRDILATAKLSSILGTERTERPDGTGPTPTYVKQEQKAEEDSDQKLNYLRQLRI